MPTRSTSLTFTSPEDTTAFAKACGPKLEVGDTLLLSGPVGAGKTHFARSLIQSLLPVPEDVPSPTFTLVQTYDAGDFEIWHTDLYRLTHADEMIELGLLDAFETALCLVEWPDRLGDLAPNTALSLSFSSPGPETQRDLHLSWTNPRWDFISQSAAHA